MAKFEINLIRTRVLPRPKRKKAFWGLVGYLAVAGVVLVLVAHHATRQIIDARWKRLDMVRIEKDFQQTHPEQTDILQYAESLQGNADKMATTLEGVEACLTQGQHLSRILFGLKASLPENTYVMGFSLDSVKQVIEVDLAAPVLTAEGRLPNASTFVSSWRRNTDLMAELSDITSTASKRMVVNGRPAFVLKFQGTLSRGGV